MNWSRIVFLGCKNRSLPGIMCKESWPQMRFISTTRKLFLQPTSTTHPHLLQKGEISPGLNADVFKNRREKMIDVICDTAQSTSRNSTNHIIVIPSASTVYMSHNIPYSFRQNSDFFYVSGFYEPNCVLIMHTTPEKPMPSHESVLFLPKPSAYSLKWEGPTMNLNEITEFLKIDKALYFEDLEKYLQTISKTLNGFTVWYDFSKAHFRQISQVMSSFFTEYTGRLKVDSPKLVLHKLRVIKCDAEVELMKKTCQIAANSMTEVIKFSHPTISEAHLQAKMEFECSMRGATRPAFPPVVGGKDRAKTIHYIDNNQRIYDSEMVLMDAGCEFYGYNSDMCRTWPINGRFTEPQRELYNLILSVQESIISLLSTKDSLDSLFRITCIKLGQGLQELDILPKSLSEEALIAAAYEMCPHHVGHYLGLDVHDTDLISRSINLLPGMVVTVEPGIYLSNDDQSVPEKYRGICIRIEDDVLITTDGYEVLTSGCPRTADEIEKLFT